MEILLVESYRDEVNTGAAVGDDLAWTRAGGVGI
jgi:hypothetical protein